MTGDSNVVIHNVQTIQNYFQPDFAEQASESESCNSVDQVKWFLYSDQNVYGEDLKVL